jgi:transposase InsO family protein
MAILQRRPPDKLLHHADQGSQYTSDEYQALLAKHRMLVSFSGVGCCDDNAPMESFWERSKPNWSIANTTEPVLKPRTPFLPTLRAATIANVVIQRWAISAPNNLNNSFSLNLVSTQKLPGHGSELCDTSV